VSPRRRRPTVLAVVAAHDEASTIARTVKALAGLASVDGIVVLADGCTDGTADEALAAGARVLVAPRRVGKGGAIESSLARLSEGEVIVLVDGDVGDTASEVDALVREVVRGRLDLAIGTLPPQHGGGFGLVKALSAKAIRALTGLATTEPLSGQRAVRREVLEACRPLAGGFGLETAMTIDAVRLGFRVGEVAVDMTHRPTGRTISGFLHRARQGADILRAVAPRALRLR
jgi:glycosyltransferase involved in cell wall biosynthesis